MSQARPRVLTLATTLPGEPGDGTPEFVLTLAQHMTPAEVTIVAPRVRGCATEQTVGTVRLRRFAYAPRRFETLADDAILPALRHRPLSVLQLPGLLFGLLRATRSEIKGWKPDVIHAHWLVPSGIVGALVARRSGTPLMITAHGGDAHTLRGRFGRSLKRWVLQRADAVHAVSVEIAEILDDLVPGCVTDVEPVGVDVTALVGRLGTRAPNPGRLLFVGRLVDKKGVDSLLTALVRVHRPWTLTVVGDGPARADLETLTKELELSARVDFRGRCTADAVAREYAQAAAVVVPSRTADDGDRDGTPVVLMEAVALGIPVVATDVGGIRELIGDRVVPEGDSDALAAAIEQILDRTDEAERTASITASQVRDTIDVARIGRSLATALGQLAGRSRRTPEAACA